MSYSDYRMNLIWASHGDQLRADLQRNIGGLTQFERQLRGSSRQLGLWGTQMKAVGTTIRYALAGAVVYGVASAVTSLGEFEQKLGAIDAMAARLTDSGHLQGLGGTLDRIGDFALETSSKWGTAVTDIEDFATRFFSSFDQASTRGRTGIRNMQEFVTGITQLQRAAGGELGDPNEIAGGIAGMIIGIPGGERNIGQNTRRISNIIAEVLRQTPTIRGSDIARDIGRLGGAQTALGMSPEEIFAVYGAAARRGGSPAVIGRGITQLLTSELLRPQTKAQKAAFAQMGLPTDPNSLRQLGGIQILNKMFQSLGLGNVSEQQRRTLGRIDDPAEALRSAGIGGPNINLIAQAFGRQESFRQFLNLMSVDGPNAIQKFLRGFADAEKQNRVEQMANLANQRNYMQRWRETQRAIGIQFLRGFAPIFEGGGWIVRQGLRGMMSLGSTGTTAVAGGAAAAAVASRLIFRSSLTGLAGRGVSRIPGVGGALGRLGLGGLLSRSSELAAASLVGAGPSAISATGLQGAGARSNPFWVVIDPLSWFMPGAPSGRGEGGPGTPTAGGSAERGRRRFPRVPLLPLGIGAASVAGANVLTLLSTPGAGGPMAGVGELAENEAINRSYPHLARLLRRTAAGRLGRPLSDVERQAFGMIGTPGTHGFHPGRANAFLERYMRQQDFSQRGRPGGLFGDIANIASQVAGQADVVIELRPTAEARRLFRTQDEKIHVPVKLWPVQTTGGPRPTTKGKAKTVRGSGGGRG